MIYEVTSDSDKDETFRIGWTKYLLDLFRFAMKKLNICNFTKQNKY